MSSLPEITCLKDLTQESIRSKILAWCQKHPSEDQVYHLVPPDDIWIEHQWDSLNIENECIAGSAAVHLVLEKLQNFPNEGLTLDQFQADDVDVFYLGRKTNQRLKLGKTDFVQVQDSTVESLLLNFDMPVCRAAYNSRYEIWISAQCLRTIFTGKQLIPEYMKDFSSFWKLVQARSSPDKDHSDQDLNNKYRHMFQRFQERIQKYISRKCLVEWFPTETILPWIQNRFHYSEWKEPKIEVQPKEQPNQLNQIETLLKQLQLQLDQIKQGQSCESINSSSD